MLWNLTKFNFIRECLFKEEYISRLIKWLGLQISVKVSKVIICINENQRLLKTFYLTKRSWATIYKYFHIWKYTFFYGNVFNRIISLSNGSWTSNKVELRRAKSSNLKMTEINHNSLMRHLMLFAIIKRFDIRVKWRGWQKKHIRQMVIW